MKKIILFLFITLLSATTFGQTRLSKAQQENIVERVGKNATRIKTIECSFSQTKSMKMLSKQMNMKGKMYFKHPSKLRWQYTSPYNYTFILNGNRVKLSSQKSTRNIDMKDNRMFKQISNIILTTFTSGSLNNQKEFSVQMFRQGNTYFAKLYPKKKEIKQIYKEVDLYFNSGLTMASMVKMVEKTGDTTIIQFNNVKTNVSINEKLFAVN